MPLPEKESFSESFEPFSGGIEYLNDSLKTFNKICYDIFQFGNIIMFLIFLFMSLKY